MEKKEIVIGETKEPIGVIVIDKDLSEEEIEKLKNDFEHFSSTYMPSRIVDFNQMPTIPEMIDLKYNHLSRKEKEADIKPIRNSVVNPKVGRNDLCICGSGKKNKKCCNIK